MSNLKLKLALVLGMVCLGGLKAEANSTTIGTLERDGSKWSLVMETEEHGGAIYVLRTVNGKTEVVGGDSSPFPLSRYGIEPEIAYPLAQLYVDYEIKNTVGGLSAIKQTLSEREYLPHDLLKAYKKYVDVRIKPVFGTNKKGSAQILDVMHRLLQVRGNKELKQLVYKKLRPLKSALIIKVAKDADEMIARELLSVVAKHPEQKDLQLVIAIYAGNQAQQFKMLMENLDTESSRKVMSSIKGALQAKLVAGEIEAKVSSLVQEFDK
jgi:hypothetical protein